MERLFSFIGPDLFEIIIVITMFVILYLIMSGKVTSVGKDGIHFTKIENGVATLVTGLEKAVIEIRAEMQCSKQDRMELHQDIRDMKMQLVEMKDSDHRQGKELLKAQIMLAETPEQKFYLYEQYKKMGGNGWMDVYIDNIRRTMTNG